MSLTVDPAFREVSRNSTGFYVWRIQKLKVVPVPREHYGVLHRGDSYIVFSASEYNTVGGPHVKSREARSGITVEMHIHFWLGSETSADEAAIAAYKTVELDDALGGAPVQHREVEGHESKRFLAYFRQGIRLLDGGVSTGLNHVTEDWTPRLYAVKGRRIPVVRQLPRVEWALINEGDVFVVDAREAVVVWIGKFANHMEKLQGAKVAQKLRSERGPRHVLMVEDGEETRLAGRERELFEMLLPLKKKQEVQDAREAERDESHEGRRASDIKLYRCSDAGGTLKVTEVKSGPLSQSDLSSEDSFILDTGAAGVWVWIGKKASHKERVEAMRNAQGFIKKKNYPGHTPVTRVIDGGEPMEFKSLFLSWKDRHQSSSLPSPSRLSPTGRVAKTVQTKFDASTLHDTPKLAAETQMVDDGSGQKEVWRVENFNLAPVEPQMHGRFYGGDCYVVLYAYTTGAADHFIVYYWIGAKSSQDEQGTAALKAVEVDDKLGGKAVQVRVVQGKEPPHFMAIFGGKMIVYAGGKASAFDGPDAVDREVSEKYLLQVRGTSQYSTKAVEVDCRGASLNSNDVFLLKTPHSLFIWAGKGSTGDEREMAKKIAATTIPLEPTLVYEGQEKADFWNAIGGKEEYASEKRLSDRDDPHPARLFQCSNATGSFKVEEIVDFDQSDLIPDDVMLLDAWDTVFLWIGTDSNRIERSLAERAAQEYLAADPAQRDQDTPVVRVKQGFEPPNFTGFFGIWDRSLWSNSKTYEQLKKELQEENPGLEIITKENGLSEETTKYSLDVLLEKDPDKLPLGIDPTKKEDYLREEDFKRAFGMGMEDFETLPNWKRQQLKKSAGLF